MKVFIIGKLGEVVKKVCELENVIEQAPNPILITELAAYQQVLASWPVEQNIDMQCIMLNFKLALAKLAGLEQELREGAGTALGGAIASQYIGQLAKVRELLSEINDIGKFIGDSPWMELKDAQSSEDDRADVR